MKYFLYLIAYILLFLVTMIFITPFLPLFRELRPGPINNANSYATEPRLPEWLKWFDTSKDNSLWGDNGWKNIHCPNYASYFGMVKWLWRNPLAGFGWYVLSQPVSITDTYTLKHSGNGTDINKSGTKEGWYLLKSSSGAWEFRYTKFIGNIVIFIESGWLLNRYMNKPESIDKYPKAYFQFQPGIRTKK